MLELPISLMGVKSKIYPTIVWDENSVVLIDAGLATSLPDIKESLGSVGISIEWLNKIIVTHQDIDHIGGIKNILDLKPDVEIFAHKEDKPYIQGDKELIRLKSNLKDRINQLPAEEQEKVLEMFVCVPLEVNITLTDGDELNECGGLVVIHTPGHTPGHICLYHKNTKTMIVGDAMNIDEGQLTGPNKQVLNEEEQILAVNSLKRFVDFDVENVICYHGGLFKDNPNKRIKELFLDYNKGN